MSHLNLKSCVVSLAVSATFGLAGCGGSGSSSPTASPSTLTPIPGFTQTNLIADLPGVATLTDPNLQNPWGIAFSPNGAFWLADNNSNLATFYSGGKVAGTITNDDPTGVQIPFGSPSGQVFNGTTGFQVSNGTTTAPALFIFCSETGWIDGWSPSVSSSQAEASVDLSGVGAVFKGLAIGSNASGNYLFATDFANAKIDVFDTNYNQATLSGSFTDPNIPSGFAPFGIQNINGTLYVTYAKQDATKHDDSKGPGNGYVDSFDTNGNLLGRLISRGNLNSPWGLTIAPTSFGQAGGMLLVGNFGDGKINVYNPSTGTYVGTLATANSAPIVIGGLWGLTFGNGGSGGDTTSLYFSSGPDSETHGVFGRLNAPATGSNVRPASKR